MNQQLGLFQHALVSALYMLLALAMVDVVNSRSARMSVGWEDDPKRASIPIYTYYSAHIVHDDEAQQQLRHWRMVWRKAGFVPKVLSVKDAETHPQYEMLRKKFWDLPTTNTKTYEMPCFLRHVAMAAAGGGLMVDYDVLPVRLSPELFHDPDYSWLVGGEFTVGQWNVPSFVVASAEEYLRVATLIANSPWREFPTHFSIADGTPHVSDMHAMNYLISIGKVKPVVVVASAHDVITRIQDSCLNRLHVLYGSVHATPLAMHYSRDSMRLLTNIYEDGATHAAPQEVLSTRIVATIKHLHAAKQNWRTDAFRLAIMKDVMLLTFLQRDRGKKLCVPSQDVALSENTKHTMVPPLKQ